jgi:hypothetical protein
MSRSQPDQAFDFNPSKFDQKVCPGKVNWWGPLDGPRIAGIGTRETDICGRELFFSPPKIGISTASSVPGLITLEQPATAASLSQSDFQTQWQPEPSVVATRRRLEEVRSAIAERQNQISKCKPLDEPGSEHTILRANIGRAIADKQSLQEEVQEGMARVQRLEEAKQRADFRVRELEDRALVQNAGCASSCAAPATASISDSSLFSIEEVPDGYSCWRDYAATLEEDVHRKAQVALDLHHRVHSLEGQLHRQIQSVDEQVSCTQKSLELILERMSAYSVP